MMDLEFIQKLIETVDGSSINSVEIEREGTRIRLAKAPEGGQVVHVPAPVAPAPAINPHAPVHNSAPAAEATPTTEAPSAEESASNLVDVTSPMVGTFYRAPSPDADPFAEVGAAIAPGDTLCIIEAMKLMNELEAEVEGTIREICVKNGEPVEFGQLLFRVEPN